ncbi:MAG: CYTH domain-containing protein [Verrucomicrobia bacterium]|nr:CYTH domain-containing protein [Verrucomicrobiota bacterium]
MNQEIERKFLLKKLPEGFERTASAPIQQGYLALEPGGNQVRLRKKGEKHSLTVKRGKGLVREEHEITLTRDQFEKLWPLTAGRRLSKHRHEIPYGGVTIEIDLYGGINSGLVVAEVEFASEAAAHAFVPPKWFAQEVSDRPEYSNRNLARE